MRTLITVASFFAFCIFILPFPAQTHEGHEHEAIKMPKEFDQVKTLVGNWEGVDKTEKGEEKFHVSYELTAGGTAIVERMFSGSPHEMLSIYHASNGKVAMTHYCMLGNHPELELRNSDDKTMNFEMVSMKSMKNEPHMHALTLTMVDKDHIKEEWVLFENGKKKDVKVINLARK